MTKHSTAPRNKCFNTSFHLTLRRTPGGCQSVVLARHITMFSAFCSSNSVSVGNTITFPPHYPPWNLESCFRWSLWRLCMLSWSVEFNSATPWTVALQSLCPWDFLGKNTRAHCHSLLQGIFPTQGSTRISCIGRQILYHRATWEGIMAAGFKLLALETNDLDLKPISTTVWPWEASSSLQAPDTSSVKWE